MRKSLGLTMGVVLGMGALTAPAAPSIGQVNNFESGNIAGWTNGAPAADPVLITGGLGGAADHLMQLTADGSGAAGKLSVFDRAAPWTGNWLTSGVTAVAMDLRNPGAAALTIRIAFKSGITGSGDPGVSITTGFTLAADSQWHHVIFPISSGSYTAFNGGTFNSVMGSVAEMRILESSSPSITGDFIVGNLGIDNVQAVPEPASLTLLAAAMGLLCTRRRTRQ